MGRPLFARNRPWRAVRRAAIRLHASRAGDESGAAIVEMAVLLPVFMTIVLGTFSGGLAYNQQLSLTHAVREGGRYGATLPEDQSTFNAPATSWTTAVQQVVLGAGAGDLDADRICVALVEGSPPAAVDAAHLLNPPSGADHCYDDGSAYTGKRVQVTAERDGRIEALVFTMDLTLTGKAAVRYEEPS